MKYLERKERNEYLLEMIEKKRCFSLKQITDKFDCSERTVKRMISELRDEGHNVKYCKSLKRFLLEN
jgi:biotin operon repressor